MSANTIKKRLFILFPPSFYLKSFPIISLHGGRSAARGAEGKVDARSAGEGYGRLTAAGCVEGLCFREL